MMNRYSIVSLCLVSFVPVALTAAPAENLDVGLTALSEHAKASMAEASTPGAHSQIAKVSSTDKDLIPGRFDEQDRVLVHVLLDGQNSLDEVGRQIESLKGAVLDRNPTYRHGILTAYVPTDQLKNVTGVLGVRALVMGMIPSMRIMVLPLTITFLSLMRTGIFSGLSVAVAIRLKYRNPGNTPGTCD